MKYPSDVRMREIALQYCREFVYDWNSLDEPTREWYIKAMIELFRKDERILKAMFQDQLN